MTRWLILAALVLLAAGIALTEELRAERYECPLGQWT